MKKGASRVVLDLDFVLVPSVDGVVLTNSFNTKFLQVQFTLWVFTVEVLLVRFKS